MGTYDTEKIYDVVNVSEDNLKKISDAVEEIESLIQNIDDACSKLTDYDGADASEKRWQEENNKMVQVYSVWQISGFKSLTTITGKISSTISEIREYISNLGIKLTDAETSANELDALAAGLKATVATKNDPLNFRTSPNGEIQGQLAIGSSLTILGVSEENGKWVHVKDENGTEGYVFTQYLDFDTNSLPTVDVTTEVSSLNIRSGPGTNNEVIGSAAHGSQVSLLSYEPVTAEDGSEWYRVVQDGAIGYVSAKYLDQGMITQAANKDAYDAYYIDELNEEQEALKFAQEEGQRQGAELDAKKAAQQKAEVENKTGLKLTSKELYFSSSNDVTVTNSKEYGIRDDNLVCKKELSDGNFINYFEGDPDGKYMTVHDGNDKKNSYIQYYYNNSENILSKQKFSNGNITTTYTNGRRVTTRPDGLTIEEDW